MDLESRCRELFETQRCEEFGARRLKSLLAELSDRPAQEIVDHLLRSTELYIDRTRRDSDDRTIVILKVK